MSQPHLTSIEDRAYPFPWSMADDALPVGYIETNGTDGIPGQLVIREDVIDIWLREFRDERTGGYSPPPMS